MKEKDNMKENTNMNNSSIINQKFISESCKEYDKREEEFDTEYDEYRQKILIYKRLKYSKYL